MMYFLLKYVYLYLLKYIGKQRNPIQNFFKSIFLFIRGLFQIIYSLIAIAPERCQEN